MRERFPRAVAMLTVLAPIVLTLVAAEGIRSATHDLAVRLVNGQGRSYALDRVKTMFFENDVLHVVTSGDDDGYPLLLIRQIEPRTGEWAGISDVPGYQGDPNGAGLLIRNIPNPFYPQTLIAFGLPRSSAVDLRVYSPGGRLVRTLLVGSRDAGEHTILWDGRDNAGHGVASGVYFARLVSDRAVATRKLVLLR